MKKCRKLKSVVFATELEGGTSSSGFKGGTPSFGRPWSGDSSVDMLAELKGGTTSSGSKNASSLRYWLGENSVDMLAGLKVGSPSSGFKAGTPASGGSWPGDNSGDVLAMMAESRFRYVI